MMYNVYAVYDCTDDQANRVMCMAGEEIMVEAGVMVGLVYM